MHTKYSGLVELLSLHAVSAMRSCCMTRLNTTTTFLIFVLAIAIAIPATIVWLMSLILIGTLFLENPILLLSSIGIPVGIWAYFKMHPEDLEKVRNFLNGGKQNDRT